MGARTAALVYEPRPAFLPLHNRSKRWACIVAHRRAGKTVAAANDLVLGSLECRKPRPQYAYIAPFREQAKRVAWDYLKHYSQPFWAGKPNESELTIPMPNGGRLMVFGADNADALRGIYLDGAFLDEFGDFKPSVWGNVIRPALSDRQGWAVFGGTPKGRNEFWQVREKARTNPQEWTLIELRASDSGILPHEEIEDVRKQLTPEQFNQEYECDFSAALQGAYYGKDMVAAEREGRIRLVKHQPSLPVYTSWDIGRKDDTAIWWYQMAGSEIHLIDFWAASGHDPASAASQILGRKVTIDIIAGEVRAKLGEPIVDLNRRIEYRYARHWLPHDAKAETFAAQGKTTIEQLASVLGFEKLGIVPDIGLQDGIQASRMTLRHCWFDDEKCSEGLEALRQYQREYDEDKKAFRERPRHDWTSHPADAFRMLAVAWREEVKPEHRQESIRGVTVGNIHNVTLEEMWKTAPKQNGGRI